MTKNPYPEIKIKIPGSIANLGPGFDTLAVAVQLYLRLSASFIPGQNRLQFRFINLKLDGENHIERAFRFVAHQHGGSFPSLAIDVQSDIPTKAGLGSSAAATVAGLRLYESIAGPLPEQELLNTASALENHPDNIAASLLGGLAISCQLADTSVSAVSVEWPESLEFLVLTPCLALSTSAARKVLPKRIAREDAVFNLQRVAMLLCAVQGRDFSLFDKAFHDRMHQPYRQKLVPGLERALGLEHPDLVGVFLSGAGPSIVALARRNFEVVQNLLERAFLPCGLSYTVRHLRVHQGAVRALDPAPARR